MRSCASFQPDQRARQIRGVGQQLGTRKLPANYDLAAFSQCYQVKGGFAQIDADGCDVHDDDPPVKPPSYPTRRRIISLIPKTGSEMHLPIKSEPIDGRE
jgi:hypothetical protein